MLTIAYDGAGFHGWQRQPGVRTVQGTLEEALARVTGQDIALAGTSRTDAGVHALGQRATLRGDFGIPTDRIAAAVNNLTKDVKILAAEDRPEGFHARFNATGKTYIYRMTILDDREEKAQAARIFLRNYRYLLKTAPNTDKMYEAARAIEGTHDFASFRAAGGADAESTVRTVHRVGMMQTDEEGPGGARLTEISIEVTGDGFLYNMIRIIAGTLLEAGLGKRNPAGIPDVIGARDRARAGHTAPASGLYLKKVYFENDGNE
ncbi:tRNA pseudouridine synthase A [Clostridia bacterium]|nr:tRNA pseudouridine synthase A [Clostridia bacterium]